MTNAEKAVQLYNNGHLCSQAILKTYAAQCGISEEQVMRLRTCFGTGIKKGEVCGACSGALMVLGFLFGQKDANDPRRRAYALIDRFLSEFSRQCGSYICNDILRCDVSTEEGLAFARENRLFTKVCPTMVETAAEILEKIIEDSHANR